jgi:hypothetical protein
MKRFYPSLRREHPRHLARQRVKVEDRAVLSGARVPPRAAAVPRAA